MYKITGTALEPFVLLEILFYLEEDLHLLIAQIVLNVAPPGIVFRIVDTCVTSENKVWRSRTVIATGVQT